jgi:surface antigen
MAQGGLGFLKNAPAGQLDEQDLQLVREATSAVLSSSDPQASRDWQNPASGNSGKVSAISRFSTEDHRECRQLRFESHTRQRGEGQATMNVCRSPGGKWLLDPDARPASASPP